ncbi:MAG: dTDP-4-dehydrorhamnose reductase [Lentisphaeria bacterium]|nr:dTDP-4-dehydrorhamnose reductase [Lentisphaeria bacterium]
MLGTEVCEVLRRAGGFEPLALDLPEFDLRDRARLEAVLADADAVVNCAAYTDVDGAEANPALADAVNHLAVGTLGALAAARGLYVLHVSTDFVFDGTLDRPYRETDQTHPINVYGATKHAGEEALRDSGANHAIVRVEWTYGRAGRHFVGKLLERAAAARELSMVADQVGAPTWTRDVAGALAVLLARRVEGLFHYAAAGYATRFEVARAVLDLAGRGDRILTPCRTADFAAAARRPLNSRFDCGRIDGILATPRPHWRDALERYLRGEAA